MTQSISLKEIEYIAHKLAQIHLAWDEPIPDFSTRFPNKLESCLQTPFMQFEGKDLYRGFNKKAAILLYLLIKNHPFQNGNKRIAVTTLLVFLLKNKKWIQIDNREFYNFTVWVAESPAVVKDETVSAIESFLSRYIQVYQ